MDAYQELLNERNKLAAQVAAQAVEINALEQSTAVRIGKRLHRFAPAFDQFLNLARQVRNSYRTLRRPKTGLAASVDAGGDKGRSTVLVLIPGTIAMPCILAAKALMSELRRSYHVVAVIIGGVAGDIIADAADEVVGPLLISEENYATALAKAESLAARYQPRFAIVASAEAAHLGLTLSTAGVPVIALVYEPPQVLAVPGNNVQTLMDRADDIIFSCETVRDLYRPFYKRMDYRRTHVIIPGQKAQVMTARLRDRLTYIAEDEKIVMGTGGIDYRNAVDVFVSVASAWRARDNETKLHFVWVGTTFDTAYAAYIDQQIERAGMRGLVTLLYQTDDTDPVYSDVDLVFTTARIDYLPSAAVDYALAGKPVMCFANAGGISEILSSHAQLSQLVVPHMDVTAATDLLGQLANDPSLCAQLGLAAQEIMQQICAVAPYAQKLIVLGEEAASGRGDYAETAALLAEDGNFDTHLYAGKIVPPTAAPKVIAEYLGRIYYDGFRKRALAGFHPEYYASQMPQMKTQRLDPLTHYLKAGRPAGPWLHRIIRLDKAVKPVADPSPVAVHGHFYYIDHIGNLLQSLAANQSQADLFLTTGSEENRQKLLAATAGYRAGSVAVAVVPNKGRDIGPFLYLYRTQLRGKYDIIGHVHGKRSLHTAKWDPNMGERWRDFLFQHLLGPKVPAMDIVLQAFRDDPKLGLVFPEDATVFGWDNNFDHAQRLCERMALAVELPPHIDFPIGTMFWARAAALEPFARLDIAWEEYPPEPLPVDGTILHALERLLPQVARAAGYEYAATYFPGVGR